MVVLVKPPTWKTTFSSVRTKDERGAVPAGCGVEFLHIDVKFLGPKRSPVPKGEPTAGPSKANERSGGLATDVDIELEGSMSRPARRQNC